MKALMIVIGMFGLGGKHLEKSPYLKKGIRGHERKSLWVNDF
jgi:hypothetical protein